MKNLIAALCVALAGGLAQSKEVQVKKHRDYYPGGKIYLKSELNRKGINHKKFKLVSVKVIASGRGPIALSMNGNIVAKKGLIREGHERRAGVYVLNLPAKMKPRFQNGHWQLHFKGGRRARIFVRKVVLQLRRKQPPRVRGQWFNFSNPRSMTRKVQKFIRKNPICNRSRPSTPPRSTCFVGKECYSVRSVGVARFYSLYRCRR